MLRPVAADNAAADRFGDGLSLLARPGQRTGCCSTPKPNHSSPVLGLVSLKEEICNTRISRINRPEALPWH